MRCPHCAGEIPVGSRFCGICGRNITVPPSYSQAGRSSGSSRPALEPDAAAVSLFALPVSRGARLARIFVVLALDLVLAGAGLAMILAYLDERRGAQKSAPAEPDAGVAASVEALPPVPAPPVPALPEPKPAPGESGSSAPGGSPPGPAPGRASGEIAKPSGRGARARTAERPPEERRRPEEPPEPQPDPGAGTDGGAQEEGPSDADVQTLARQIQLVVGRHQAQLERCYQRAAKATSPSQPLEGRIEVRFTVMPDGSAADVTPSGNTTGSGELARCVAGLVESWAFPAGRSQPVPFVWPFRFKAPDQP